MNNTEDVIEELAPNTGRNTKPKSDRKVLLIILGVWGGLSLLVALNMN